MSSRPSSSNCLRKRITRISGKRSSPRRSAPATSSRFCTTATGKTSGRFAPFTMTYRWKRKRPIPSNTRTVTINPAQTITNSRLRTAMTNIQSPLLDPVPDAARHLWLRSSCRFDTGQHATVTGASLRESRFPIRCHEDLLRCVIWMRKPWFLRDAGLCRTGNWGAARNVGQHQGNDVGG